METIICYCKDNNDLIEFESLNRGYRSDIYVAYQNNYYNLNVYDTIRLIQDFDTEYGCYGYYSIDPNLILVKEVTLKNIKMTIEKLAKQKYFDKIKPMQNKDFNTSDYFKF